MLLQTNSYIVPKDKRAEHARLLRRFRASLAKLGCDSFEVYEQVGSNWTTGEPTGRYVQIMRFRDRRHQLAVQAAERTDPSAQAIIAEFCQLINFPYQQQQGLFAVGFYNSVLPVAPSRPQAGATAVGAGAGAAAGAAGVDPGQGSDPIAAAVEGDATPDAAEYVAAAEEGEAPEVEAEGAESGVTADDDAGTLSGEEELEESEVGEAEADEGDAEDHELDAMKAEASETAVDTAEGGEAADDETDDAIQAESDVDEPETAAPGGGESGGPDAHALDEGPAPADDVGGLGALLDAHIHTAERPDSNGDLGHPLAGPQGAGEEAPECLDALDLDALDLPEEPTSEPHRTSNHAAR